MKTQLPRAGRRILAGIVLAYTLAYFNRLNLSAALSGIIADLKVTPSEAGLAQTCFAVVYACGQMVNGVLADRVDLRRHVILGLAGSVICNLLLGVIGRYGALIALCALNGAFQSMLWTPLVCLIAANFAEGEEELSAHFYLSLTLAIGHFCAWGVSGLACQSVGWRWGFILPALITAPLILLVALLLKNAHTRLGRRDASDKKKGPSLRESAGVLIRTGFPFLMGSAFLYGFVKDGVMTWTPEMLNAASSGNAAAAAVFSLIVPALNLAGIILGYSLRRRSRSGTRRVIARFLPFMGLCCAPLLLGRSLLLTALCAGLTCACAYGINPLYTSLVPMEYERAGCVGLAAGLCDSVIYAGASLSGVAGGALYGSFSGAGLALSWIAAAVIAAAFMAASAGASKKELTGIAYAPVPEKSRA